jgi:Holliday junction resolvase-like predicted endonuclease
MKKSSSKRNARIKGGRAEALLLTQLTEQGYEARRTHLSAFPDIIAWNENDILLIEVKARSNDSTGLSNALSLFRANVKTMTYVPKTARILCYVRLNGAWSAYEWCDNATKRIEPIVFEER